mmetsp:Transcript_29460/g.84706  ORF Transcript_29460/g.84706 Transcript_29460/m.84706 type:complete len:419 (+) Transcript_29460:707-1963(+)
MTFVRTHTRLSVESVSSTRTSMLALPSVPLSSNNSWKELVKALRCSKIPRAEAALGDGESGSKASADDKAAGCKVALSDGASGKDHSSGSSLTSCFHLLAPLCVNASEINRSQSWNVINHLGDPMSKACHMYLMSPGYPKCFMALMKCDLLMRSIVFWLIASNASLELVKFLHINSAKRASTCSFGKFANLPLGARPCMQKSHITNNWKTNVSGDGCGGFRHSWPARNNGQPTALSNSHNVLPFSNNRPLFSMQSSSSHIVGGGSSDESTPVACNSATIRLPLRKSCLKAGTSPASVCGDNGCPWSSNNSCILCKTSRNLARPSRCRICSTTKSSATQRKARKRACNWFGSRALMKSSELHMCVHDADWRHAILKARSRFAMQLFFEMGFKYRPLEKSAPGTRRSTRRQSTKPLLTSS